MALNDLPIKPFKSPADFESWLDEHVNERGVLIKIAKKNSGVKSISYSEAVDVALAYGWIDSQARALDDKFYLQKFTPRGPKSIWSKVNRSKIERLVSEGKMKPNGLAAVEAAKSDGRWDAAYDPSSTSRVPSDLKMELDKRPEAKKFFESLNSANRYAVLFRIQTAKTPEARAKKIAKLVDMLLEKKTLH